MKNTFRSAEVDDLCLAKRPVSCLAENSASIHYDEYHTASCSGRKTSSPTSPQHIYFHFLFRLQIVTDDIRSHWTLLYIFPSINLVYLLPSSH